MTNYTQLRDAFANADSQMKRTIGVVDMNDSTGMKEKQAETAWLTSLAWFYELVTRTVLEAINGAMVKYVGDGVMFVCETSHTTAAVNAVIRIQEALREAGTRSNGKKGVIDFTCSAAVTTGSVRGFTTPVGTPDYVGSVVDKAFRLCGYANQKAIFVDTGTVLAANAMDIESRFGQAVDRQDDEYIGKVLKAPLKGFAQAVEYHEIHWDQDRYSVDGNEASANTERLRLSGPSQPVGVDPAGRPDRHRGEITHWNRERNCGVVRDALSGEDFYASTRLMVYPEDAAKNAMGREVAFVAVGTAEANRKRQAGALLLVGEPAEGPLVSRPQNKSYGWARVEDGAGNRQLIYVPAGELADHQVGDLISFTVAVSDKGASAEEVECALDDAA